MVDFAKLLEKSRDPEWRAEQQRKQDEEEARRVAHEKMLEAAVEWCRERHTSISERELSLVHSVRNGIARFRMPTPAQEKWLLDIAKRLGFEPSPAPAVQPGQST